MREPLVGFVVHVLLRLGVEVEDDLEALLAERVERREGLGARGGGAAGRDGQRDLAKVLAAHARRVDVEAVARLDVDDAIDQKVHVEAGLALLEEDVVRHEEERLHHVHGAHHDLVLEAREERAPHHGARLVDEHVAQHGVAQRRRQLAHHRVLPVEDVRDARAHLVREEAVDLRRDLAIEARRAHEGVDLVHLVLDDLLVHVELGHELGEVGDDDGEDRRAQQHHDDRDEQLGGRVLVGADVAVADGRERRERPHQRDLVVGPRPLALAAVPPEPVGGGRVRAAHRDVGGGLQRDGVEPQRAHHARRRARPPDHAHGRGARRLVGAVEDGGLPSGEREVLVRVDVVWRLVDGVCRPRGHRQPHTRGDVRDREEEHDQLEDGEPRRVHQDAPVLLHQAERLWELEQPEQAVPAHAVDVRERQRRDEVRHEPRAHVAPRELARVEDRRAVGGVEVDGAEVDGHLEHEEDVDGGVDREERRRQLRVAHAQRKPQRRREHRVDDGQREQHVVRRLEPRLRVDAARRERVADLGAQPRRLGRARQVDAVGGERVLPAVLRRGELGAQHLERRLEGHAALDRRRPLPRRLGVGRAALAPDRLDRLLDAQRRREVAAEARPQLPHRRVRH